MTPKDSNTIIRINPEKLLTSFQIRVPDPMTVKEYAESIKHHRQLQAITVKYEAKGDGLQLIDGQHRAEACKLLGIDVRAEVVAMTDTEAIQAAMIANDKRKPLTSLERYLWLERMEKVGCSNATIAKTFGWTSSSRVSEVKRINHYPFLLNALKNKALCLEQCAVTAKALSSLKIRSNDPVIERVIPNIKEWGSVPPFESTKDIVRQAQDGARFGAAMAARAEQRERLQTIEDRKLKRQSITLDFSIETPEADLIKLLKQAEMAVCDLKGLIRKAQSPRKKSA